MANLRRALRALLPGREAPGGAAEIRPARAADLPAIAGLLREGDRHHRAFDRRAIRQEDPEVAAEDGLRAWLDDPATLVLVAEAPGKLAGGVAGFLRAVYQARPASRLRQALKVVAIEEIVVAEGARGQGTGTRLMGEAESWARDRGADRLELGVYDANDAALTLYADQGYRTLIRTLVRDL